MIKRFLLFVSILFSCGHSLANTEFTFEYIDGGIEITGCFLSCPSDLEIPASYYGNSVISIGELSFQNNQLTSVSIPDSLVSIGEAAFSRNLLTNITIPDNVENIGDYAFSENLLTNITIPNNIENIGDYAFSENQITTIQIPDNMINMGPFSFVFYQNPGFSYGDWNYFLYNDTAMVIGCNNSCPTNLTVPSTIDDLVVTRIGERAFHDKQLVSVTIPNTITSIGAGAFLDNQLTTVIIPESVTAIEGAAFAKNQLVDATIPEGVVRIGIAAFAINQLTSLNIPDSVTDIGYGVFSENIGNNNGEYRYFLIRDYLVILGCFEWCSSDLIIPEEIDGYDVRVIGYKSFVNSNLLSVSLPNSIVSIEDDAFEDNQLTSVIIPDSVTSISYGAFRGNQLTSVTIPDSVTSIGKYAFEDNQLTNITIPDSVTSIGSSAFKNNLLTNISFLGEAPRLVYSSFNSNPLISITYCQNNNGGWDDEVIEGIAPVQDENCESDNDVTESAINWDFDQSGNFDALTDGLLLLRYAFGLRSDSLTSGAISAESTLSQAEVESNIEQALSIADIDNSGAVDALTDGLMLLRYAFGLRGESLISGAVSTQGLRNTATDIEAYIESHMP